MELKNENDFERAITLFIDAHWTHIEMPFKPGFPDLDYCITGVCGQIEVKFVKKGRVPHLRSTQKAWMRERLKANGSPMIWMLDGTKVYVICRDGIEKLLIGNSSLSIWKSLAADVIDLNWTDASNSDPWFLLEQWLYRKVPAEG